MTATNRAQLAFVLGYDGEGKPAGVGMVYVGIGDLSPELFAGLVEGIKTTYRYADEGDMGDMERLELERTLLSYAPTPDLMLAAEEVTADIRHTADELGIELDITPVVPSCRQLPRWASHPAK